MLVALRLVIGWHFFREGVSHRNDPHWSSEGFLKQAKGPLAPLYQGSLPDLHGWNRLMLAPLPPARAGAIADAGDTDDVEAAPKAAEKKNPAKEPAAKSPVADSNGKALAVGESRPAKAAAEAKKNVAIYDAWLEGAKRDWKADADQMATFYNFSAEQRQQADELVNDAAKRAEELLASHEPDIRMYRELVARADAMARKVGANDDPPNQGPRAIAAEKNPLGEAGLNGQSSPLSTTPAVWQSGASAIDHLFHDRLAGLATPDQLKQAGAPPASDRRVHEIDSVVTWLLIGVGACLIVGLFTRVAAVLGALFLLSIVLTQPPWMADAIPTYNQWVELVAMLALATVPVGRWAGLDYFVSLVCCRRCCAAEGKKA